MTFTELKTAQWVIFFVLAAIVFIFQIPTFVCKTHWQERYDERLSNRKYNVYLHLPWFAYMILWLVALVASAIGNGVVWSAILDQNVSNPDESNSLFVGGFILVLISYCASLFWTHFFMGRALPRFTKPELKQKLHISAYWINWAFALSTIAFVSALLALIFYWIETSNAWVMIFYPIFLFIIWVFNLLVVLNEHYWEDDEKRSESFY